MIIKVGSDFCGIGAFNQALKYSGRDAEHVFACDFNLHARITYLATWGTAADLQLAISREHRYFATNVEKICLGESKLTESEQQELLSDADVFANRFSFYYPFNVYDRQIPEDSIDFYMTSPPCQAFSVAGKREGKESVKGILFFNSLEFIKTNNPRFFVFENVQGLLSHDEGKTFGEWIRLLGGKSVNGLPILFADDDSVPYHIYWKVLNSKKHGTPQNRERVFIIGIRDDVDNMFHWPVEEHLEKKLKDVLENDIEEKYFLSEKMLEKITFELKKNGEVANLNKGGERGSVFSDECEIMTCLSATDYKQPKQIISGTWRTHKDGKGFRPTEDNNCPTIPARSREDGSAQPVICIPVLTPDRLEKRQNGRRFKNDGEEMFTITTQDRHGLYDGYRIRRLTPLECLRLMSFEDDIYINARHVMSDSQFYKQAGNSIDAKLLSKIINRIEKL